MDSKYMRRALQLALQGQGSVEPNPMVGCVVVRDQRIVGEGWHQRFGGPHAEVEALAAAGEQADGATLYVTLEPCCHQGKTPPCSDAILRAGIRRAVVAMRDPYEQVDGSGLEQLRQAGCEVILGVEEEQARQLVAPFTKLVTQRKPWVIAKWAMTLDGKIASRTGHSQWISNEASREVVHRMRGRMDAIVVGADTVRADDPRLTARPPGPRIASRVVITRTATLDPNCQLAVSAKQFPTIIAHGVDASRDSLQPLASAGCELVLLDGDSDVERLGKLLEELGRRSMTNVLLEGGSQLLGNAWDANFIDEVHVFVAPKLVGGSQAPSPLMGRGRDGIPNAASLETLESTRLGNDLYLHGRLRSTTGE